MREGVLEPGALAAWRGFLRVHSALTKQLDAELLASHRISLSSYEVLLFLADSPEGRLRMSDLADSVLLSRSGLTRLVDRLCRGGLLERASCEDDRRGAYARLTDAGVARFEAARPTHLRGVREHFLDHLGATDQEALGRAFDLVLNGGGGDVPGGLPKKPLPSGTSFPPPRAKG